MVQKKRVSTWDSLSSYHENDERNERNAPIHGDGYLDAFLRDGATKEKRPAKIATTIEKADLRARLEPQLFAALTDDVAENADDAECADKRENHAPCNLQICHAQQLNHLLFHKLH